MIFIVQYFEEEILYQIFYYYDQFVQFLYLPANNLYNLNFVDPGFGTIFKLLDTPDFEYSIAPLADNSFN